MYVETTFVLLGAAILSAAYFLSLFLLRILRMRQYVQLWLVLQAVTLILILSYGFTALALLGLELFPEWLTPELAMAFTLFYSAMYFGILILLTRKNLGDIFGTSLSDQEAILRFKAFTEHPASLESGVFSNHYSVKCDTCRRKIEYSIADIVRAHSKLERGISLEKGLGHTNYIFYVMHDCNGDYREIPVQHDDDLSLRSERPSRIFL